MCDRIDPNFVVAIVGFVLSLQRTYVPLYHIIFCLGISFFLFSRTYVPLYHIIFVFRDFFSFFLELMCHYITLFFV